MPESLFNKVAGRLCRKPLYEVQTMIISTLNIVSFISNYLRQLTIFYIENLAIYSPSDYKYLVQLRFVIITSFTF